MGAAVSGNLFECLVCLEMKCVSAGNRQHTPFMCGCNSVDKRIVCDSCIPRCERKCVICRSVDPDNVNVKTPEELERERANEEEIKEKQSAESHAMQKALSRKELCNYDLGDGVVRYAHCRFGLYCDFAYNNHRTKKCEMCNRYEISNNELSVSPNALYLAQERKTEWKCPLCGFSNFFQDVPEVAEQPEIKEIVDENDGDDEDDDDKNDDEDYDDVPAHVDVREYCRYELAFGNCKYGNECFERNYHHRLYYTCHVCNYTQIVSDSCIECTVDRL
jgi:hypothetical protein